MSSTTSGGRSHSEEKDAAEIKKAIATGSRESGGSNAAGVVNNGSFLLIQFTDP